jgi:hypothetical protein
MSDFDLYILKKYLFIPLLVLCYVMGPSFAVRAPSRPRPSFSRIDYQFEKVLSFALEVNGGGGVNMVA